MTASSTNNSISRLFQGNLLVRGSHRCPHFPWGPSCSSWASSPASSYSQRCFPTPPFPPVSWYLMLLVKTEVYQVALPPVLWISFNLDELRIIENFVQETIQRHYSLSYVYISLVCVVFFHKIQSKHTYVVKNTEENR